MNVKKINVDQKISRLLVDLAVLIGTLACTIHSTNT